jgi:nickel/cobalt transporter (NiCoT) family protein
VGGREQGWADGVRPRGSRGRGSIELEVIGTVELGGLIASQPNLSGSFWSGFENINLNLLGFAIVGMFIAAWAIALTVWRFGRIEKRWSLHLSTSAKSE